MFNIIAIHLNKFKSVEDFQRMLDDNNLDQLDAKKIYEQKSNGCTKLFIDKSTQSVMAYNMKGQKEITFQNNLRNFLKNLKSIDYNKGVYIISIDTILDKINKNGLESLSKREKEFLENIK